MHVALLALFLVLATTLHAFQAFWSSARQTPGIPPPALFDIPASGNDSDSHGPFGVTQLIQVITM